MGGGSRGAKKPKLRDLSVDRLTPQEQDDLIDAIGATSTPIAKAILGAVLVEHELEVSLRRRIGIWTAAGLVDKSQPHAAALSNASGLTPPRWL